MHVRTQGRGEQPLRMITLRRANQRVRFTVSRLHFLLFSRLNFFVHPPPSDHGVILYIQYDGHEAPQSCMYVRFEGQKKSIEGLTLRSRFSRETTANNEIIHPHIMRTPSVHCICFPFLPRWSPCYTKRRSWSQRWRGEVASFSDSMAQACIWKAPCTRSCLNCFVHIPADTSCRHHYVN